MNILAQHTYFHQAECSSQGESYFSPFYKGVEVDVSDILIKDISMLFVLEGRLNVSYSSSEQKIVEEGHFVLLLPESKLSFITSVGVKAIFCCCNNKLHFWNDYKMEDLEAPDKAEGEECISLEINAEINTFLSTILLFHDKKVFPPRLQSFKVDELFCLLTIFYSKEELSAFWGQISGEDAGFKEQVLKNYLIAKNVEDLAQMLNYSISGFNKKFKRNFSQSASQWIRERKAKVIFKELVDDRLPIKEIVFRHNFSSLPHFNEFCKRMYGKTPGRIQKHSQSNEGFL